MKNSRIKIFIAIAMIVLVGGVAYYFVTSTQPPLTPPYQGGEQGEVGGEKEGVSQNIYENNKYGFSFGHSKELSVSEFAEEGVDIVLAGDVFQISISPFDEPGLITKERILKDIPNMRISNDKEISVDGEKALSFRSKDKSGDETQEIWFVRSGNLYQISAFPSFGDKLEEIIKTWKF